MASLKEVKTRIASVRSTQKITSAMHMVASAKLRRAQSQIESFLPYQTRLMGILNNFLSSQTDFTSPLASIREVKTVAIIAISSNSSLCGAFNANAIRLFTKVYRKYSHLPKENILVYPIGKRIEAAILKEEIATQGSFQDLMDKPNFEQVREMMDKLMEMFLQGKVDRVEVVYNHFQSMAVQVLTNDQLLPIDLSIHSKESSQETEKHISTTTDYLIEPNETILLETLLPKSLRSKLYSVILDSAAAEQAARAIAMRIATDNAEDIIEELTLLYNKQRQQAITNELLDIISGSSAIR